MRDDMSKKIRILQLSNSSHYSGAENVICQIIGMFRDDTDVEMAYACRRGQIGEALAERDIAYFPMTAVTKKELGRVLAEYRPDIIHAHDARATLIASLFPGKARLVSTMHGNDLELRALGLKSVLFRLAARKMRHIFWVSQSCFEGYRFKKTVAAKSSILPNVIDRDALLRKMETDKKTYAYDIAFVGRMETPKNPLRLAAVLALAAAKNPGLRAAVAGNGSLENDFTARITALGIDTNVDFLGFQDNPYKMLHDAKVMVMTSAWEGTPMVALEAMALGVPIVSTPTDGMVDLVRDGETGFLSDDDTVLAGRLVEIAGDPNLHRRLSAASEQRFHEISDIGAYKQRLRDAYFG